MRDVARSIIDAFGFAKSLMYKTKAFNDDYYKQARKDVDADYEYRRDKLGEEYEGIYKTKRREYEDARDLIENSTMDEATKREALKKLHRDYEDWVDLSKKQEKENLLAIEKQHQLDLDKIRKDEDTARQKHADDELRRQNSLWEKVKGVFGTACENMATIFLTKMFEPIGDAIGRLAGKLIGKGVDSVADAMDGVGEKTQSLGKTIGDFIGGIGTGIGTFIAGLAAGVGTAIVTLATAVAEAATILAAAAPALMIVGAIALALYAGVKLLGAIFGSAGGGSGDGLGRVVERQDIQTSLLTTIKDFCLNNISLGIQWTGKCMDYLWEANGYLRSIADAMGGFGGIIDAIKGIPGAQAGAVSTQTQLMMVHGSPERPEYIMPLPDLQSFAANMAPTQAGERTANTNLTFNIHALDGTDMVNVVRNKIVPLLKNMAKNETFQIHPRAIRAY
jgi:hypothetical protein